MFWLGELDTEQYARLVREKYNMFFCPKSNHSKSDHITNIHGITLVYYEIILEDGSSDTN